jgi:hypothetical protein
MLISPRCAKPGHAHKNRAANVPDSVHSVLVEQAVESFGCRPILRFASQGRSGKNFATIAGVRQFHCPRVTAERELWMNAFIAVQVVAIRAWWRRNFPLAAGNVATAGATVRNGNSFSWSAAGFFSGPAPTIRPTTTAAARTVITATATDMAASKRKPSIVRVIRVRRRPWVGKVARERNP